MGKGLNDGLEGVEDDLPCKRLPPTSGVGGYMCATAPRKLALSWVSTREA